MRWAGCVLVVCIGQKRNEHRVLVGEPEGKIMLGRSGVDGRIILKWILEK